MWAKYNQKSNAYNTWIVADGPVDAIWIEVRRHPPHLHTQGEIVAPRHQVSERCHGCCYWWWCRT